MIIRLCVLIFNWLVTREYFDCKFEGIFNYGGIEDENKVATKEGE